MGSKDPVEIPGFEKENKVIRQDKYMFTSGNKREEGRPCLSLRRGVEPGTNPGNTPRENSKNFYDTSLPGPKVGVCLQELVRYTLTPGQGEGGVRTKHQVGTESRL